MSLRLALMGPVRTRRTRRPLKQAMAVPSNSAIAFLASVVIRFYRHSRTSRPAPARDLGPCTHLQRYLNSALGFAHPAESRNRSTYTAKALRLDPPNGHFVDLQLRRPTAVGFHSGMRPAHRAVRCGHRHNSSPGLSLTTGVVCVTQIGVDRACSYPSNTLVEARDRAFEWSATMSKRPARSCWVA